MFEQNKVWVQRMTPSIDSPMHTQLYNSLKGWFTDEFTPSDQLPTEQDIMKRFSVGRGTVRTALNELVRDGIIIRTPGKGSFLDPDYRVRLKRYSVAILLSEREFSGSDSWEYSWHNHMEMLNGVMKEALLKNISLEIIPESAIGPELNRDYDAFISFRYIRAGKLSLLTRPVIPFHYELDLADGLAGIVRHLAGCGYRNPAYIGTARAGRITLINSFLEMNGLSPLSGSLVIECSGTSRDGYEACSALLETGERPDCIICSTDMRALGVLSCLRERRIAVPDELGVYGFDGIREGGCCIPSLTTWAFPWQKLGTRAVCELRSLLDGTDIPPYRILKGGLVSRGSTADKTAKEPEGWSAGPCSFREEEVCAKPSILDRRIVHLPSFGLDFFLRIGEPAVLSPGTGVASPGKDGSVSEAASPRSWKNITEEALKRAERQIGRKVFAEFSLASDGTTAASLPCSERTAGDGVLKARSARVVWEGTMIVEALDYPLPAIRLSGPDHSSLFEKTVALLKRWEEREQGAQQAGLLCFRESGLFRVCLFFYSTPPEEADSPFPSGGGRAVCRAVAAGGSPVRFHPVADGEDLEAWIEEYYRRRRPGGIFRGIKTDEILPLFGRE